MIEKPTRIGDLLNLRLITKKKLVDVNVKDYSDCRDQKMVDFRILRGGKKVKMKLISLDFRIADLGPFKDLLGRVPLDKDLEERWIQESWLEFKDLLLHVISRKSSKNAKSPLQMNKLLLAKLREKGGIQNVEARMGNLGGIHRHCLSTQG